jgi:hypothetical protein
MAVPKCPVCGSEAVDFDQQETFSASVEGWVTQGDANIVVCHCAMSHRFLVSPSENVPCQSKSNDLVTFLLPNKRQIRAA